VGLAKQKLASPPQPRKAFVGDAMSIMVEFRPTKTLQVPPPAEHFIPTVGLVTEPLPVTKMVREGLKVALTVVLAVTFMVQVPVPVHPAPDHPANDHPGSGVAVSVTDVAVA
jgi:hypothetical protein